MMKEPSEGGALPPDPRGPWRPPGGSPPEPNDPATFHAVGGEPFFRKLVEDFYGRVERDAVLRPLFPPSLAEGKERQFLFLCQFFGGPGEYSAMYGHPRLRARHLPFPIGQEQRDRWLSHMLAALEGQAPPEPHRSRMAEYFARTSQFLINRSGTVRADFPQPPPGETDGGR